MTALASQLTEQVTIQQPAFTNDGYGGKTVSWTTLATVAAEVKPLLGYGMRRVVAGQSEANAGYRVVIRLRTDVTAAMRLVWKTHTLLIHSLHEMGATLNILAYEENL